MIQFLYCRCILQKNNLHCDCTLHSSWNKTCRDGWIFFLSRTLTHQQEHQDPLLGNGVTLPIHSAPTLSAPWSRSPCLKTSTHEIGRNQDSETYRIVTVRSLSKIWLQEHILTTSRRWTGGTNGTDRNYGVCVCVCHTLQDCHLQGKVCVTASVREISTTMATGKRINVFGTNNTLI